MTTYRDRDPDELERLAFDNPLALLELDPATRKLHLTLGYDRYVSTPLHAFTAVE